MSRRACWYWQSGGWPTWRKPGRLKIKQAVAYEGALKTAALALDEAPQGYLRCTSGWTVAGTLGCGANTLGSQMNLVVLQELNALLSTSRQAVDACGAFCTGEVAAVAVPFLSTNVSHGSFDLFGGHYGVACQSCTTEQCMSTAIDCKSPPAGSVPGIHGGDYRQRHHRLPI